MNLPNHSRMCGVVSRLSRMAGAALLLASIPLASAENCQPRWRLGSPGTDGRVTAMTQHENRVIAIGDFAEAGDAEVFDVAAFDGNGWSPLGYGFNSLVRALAVHDDGRGPALYVGGDFTESGDHITRRIARWDGAAWSSVGWGLGGGSVFTMRSFDDGRGPALYVGGSFRTAGGVAADRVARWDGNAWSSVGEGLGGGAGVYALEVFQQSGKPRLCAGGRFFNTHGAAAQNFAMWDGKEWDAPAGFDGDVFALRSFQGRDGSFLYAGGCFRSAGGARAEGLARWDGMRWAALPRAIRSGFIRALAVFDDGNGPALYFGGEFHADELRGLAHVGRWDGAQLRSLGSGANGRVLALLPFNDGNASTLYLGGEFTGVGRGPAEHFARWGCSLMPDVVGDLNCDGVVGRADLPAMLTALTRPDEYRRRYEDCPLRNGDVDNDKELTLRDLPKLVEQIEAVLDDESGD